ncbi:MAG: carboxypeptidase-like regulatory domain-containing protein, partial [Muribaculaceae bacterium]|nr:carboxypeptidase-like regulatory domain-containing protein [Muribaculaceae bacterium]
QTMGFNGKIYVPLGDTTMFVKKITMRTPSDINMNLIDNIFINLSYEKDSVGNRIKVYDDVCIEMSLLSKLPKIYGRKTTIYDNFSYEMHSLLKPYYSEMGSLFISEESGKKDLSFWNEVRKIPLSVSEERMGGLMKQIRKNPILYWGEKGLKLLVEGYIKTGNPSKFEIGPINTFISGNTVEGVRLRFGGMTMAALNPHFFASGYVAYGTRDRKWKYEGLLEYSFPSKRNFFNEWPRHGFSLRYKYDIDMLGQHYLFANADNVFLSFKRMESVLATYQRQGSLSYIFELPNNFSLETGIKLWKQEATGWVPFKFSDGRILTHYRENSISVSLRWAPGEKFIQGRTKRSPVNMDTWIFQLTHEFGPKGLFNSAFTINNTELSVRKRFWFSAFGYTDMILKGGIIWSSVYFPALMWPNANLTYTIQPESYSLMNPMEFANDKYASVDLSYFGLGVLFNRIPLLKRLKLREVVTFKALTGGLSDRNNPSKNEDLLLFPSQAQTQTLSSVPYMEAGVGIDNIFMFLRVDYVWRLTYRNTPGCDKSGVRISLHFSF